MTMFTQAVAIVLGVNWALHPNAFSAITMLMATMVLWITEKEIVDREKNERSRAQRRSSQFNEDDPNW